MILKLNPLEKKILELIETAGQRCEIPVYAIGGFVRDKIIGRESKDIDIVCLGNAIRLAEEVSSMLRPIPKLNFFERFGTAQIRHKDLEIEFVGARKESYHPDSRKPEVSTGTLADDQLRRDFTINAISISLNPENFGEIIDPFDGLNDISKKIIKTPVPPELTFSDDPLRMMRAIRFATQLDYKLDEPVEVPALRYLLYSLSGYELYLKTYRGNFQPKQVLEQILFNEQFPHSVHYCLKQLSRYFTRLETHSLADSYRHLEFLIGRTTNNVRYSVVNTGDPAGLEQFLLQTRAELFGIAAALNQYYFGHS